MAAFALVAIAACESPVSVDDREVTVLISPDDPGMGVGDLLAFQAVVANDTTAGPNRGVTWTTSNAAVVGIDATTGNATALAVGQAKIIATSKHKPAAKDSVTVTVTAIAGVAAIPVIGRGLVSERYTAEVAAANGYAYTSTWNFRVASGNVVKVWDVSSPVPVLVDSLKIANATTTSDVQISPDGSLLVVSTEGGAGRIVIYSLADPAHPTFLSQFQHADTERGVHTVKLSVIGGKLYGFLQIDPLPAALMIVDMSNPLLIQAVHYQVMGTPFVHDVFVRDGLLFAALWNDGMSIFDVGGGGAGGSPSSPVLLGNVHTPTGKIHNIWWLHDPATGEKKYALLGEEGPGSVGTGTASGDIHVVDVSDLTNPHQVAIFSLAGAGTHNFFVDEQSMVLYAAYYNAGVRAIDVQGDLGTCTPAQKVTSGAYAGMCDLRHMNRELAAGLTTGAFVWGVTMQGNRLYASDMKSGLAVLDISALKR